MDASDPDGALENIASVIGRRWKLTLIYHLLDGQKRFSNLQKELGISQRMLTVKLRELEDSFIPDWRAPAEAAQMPFPARFILLDALSYLFARPEAWYFANSASK